MKLHSKQPVKQAAL